MRTLLLVLYCWFCAVPFKYSTMASNETIKLDQFLKLVGIVPTGGAAKLLIQAGEVKVNGLVETRRGRKLIPGDRVLTMGETFTVEVEPAPEP